MITPPQTMLHMEQQELDGLISKGRIQYGQVCVSQHELGATLLKIRDLTKAQGSRKGKGFEACLEAIGISKTQAYRFMRAAKLVSRSITTTNLVPLTARSL